MALHSLTRRHTFFKIARIALMSLGIMTGPATTQSPETLSVAPAPALSGLSNPTLAFNLSSAIDYAPGLQFLDIMKLARPWIGHEPGKWGGMGVKELQADGYLDPKGWPIKIPDGIEKIGTIWQWHNHQESIEYRAGIYIVTYDGIGDLRIEGDARMLQGESGKLRFFAGGGNLYLNIYDTDPDQTGDHLRNIKIVKEENVALYEAGAIFNPDWLALISDSRELRFMDWMQTNNSDVENWDERVTADSAPISGMVAIEHMVQLANEVGADPWFTMPHKAKEEFIRNFAIYVRDNLDPNLTVKVEYSNEVWNWAFKQTHWLRDQSKLDWGKEAHIDYHAKKAVETAIIWEETFGDEAETRLVNVLGTQAVNTWLSKRLLDPVVWRKNEPNTFVEPTSVFEELAVTTYFGVASVSNAELRSELTEKIKDPTVDAMAYLFKKLKHPQYQQSIPQVLTSLRGQATLAEDHGLRLTAYEGGQHVHHSFAVRDLSEEDLSILTNFLTEFVRSRYMVKLYQRSWRNWMEVGDGPYMNFGDMVRPSKWGSFGVYESLDNITQRGQFLRRKNAKTDPWWEGSKGGTHYQSGVVRLGTQEDNIFRGTSQEDYLIGFKGNDIFHASPGNDGLNGGDGTDRVVFEGALSDYMVRKEGDGYRIEGQNSSTFLIQIEEIVFEDGAVHLINDTVR